MKTIYSLTLLLLFTQFACAQTNVPALVTNVTVAPTNAPLALPVPRRAVPLRGTNSPAPTFNPNATAAPSPLAPPTISTPSMTTKTTVRTNAVGEVANIEYNFPQLPLEQGLENYAKLVGRTILRSPQIQPTLQLTLKTESPLTQSEAIMAWETIMGMNGITIVPIGDKFMKVVVEAQAPGAGGKFSEKTGEELPDAGRFVTHIVQIKYAVAAEVQAAISPFAKNPAAVVAIPTSNTLILRDYSENVKRMLEVIEKIDIVSELNVKPEVIPIKYALASDIQQVLGSLTASGPGISVGRSTRGASTTPGGYQPGAPGSLPIQGQPNPQPGLGQSGLNTAGTSGRSRFQQNLQNIVSRIASGGSGDFQVIGQAKIIADDRTNSLLIFANDQDMVMIKTIISQLDVVLAQVLIEAIVMEVTLEQGQNLGVSYLQQPKRAGNVDVAGGVNNGQPFLNPRNFFNSGGTNGGAGVPLGIGDLPGGFSYFAKIGDDFDVALTAIATDGRVNVLSRPRIQTSHAVPATLFIGDTVPYITGSSYGDFGGNFGNSRSTYQEKRVGITLDVLPLINPDGLVVMDIQQNIQQLGTTIKIDNNDVPTTTERSASAKVAVRDRETIILGGFITTSKSKTKSGVPFLKDIPLLGAAFRSTTDSSKRVELIILMKPTVLPTPEAAALVAASEKDKMSGVKQGEYEIREEERKRQEKIEREMRKKLGIKERSL
ncbi:MAG: secretin N-terminal domain-containing protein [Verrucomicrobiota bacterium]